MSNSACSFSAAISKNLFEVMPMPNTAILLVLDNMSTFMFDSLTAFIEKTVNEESALKLCSGLSF
jgi:hypothetical protein